MKRRRQAVGLPLAAAAGLGAAGALAADGLAVPVTGLVSLTALVLMGREMLSARRLEAAVYPYAGAALGMVFTWTLATNLVRRDPVRPGAPTWNSEDGAELPAPTHRASRAGFWPLIAILLVQGAFSLSLVWSNTAFGDEALYLWQGRLEWLHWLHGTPIPSLSYDSGAPQIYPPLGALANDISGLAGARILSAIFMIVATVLLYLTARRLFSEMAALAGCALWAVSEPVLRLTYATYDAMACLLVILSVWLAVQASVRSRRGELVVLSGAVLALASVTAFSFAILIPVVIAVAFCIWQLSLGVKAAAWCAGWLSLISVFLTVATLTTLHLWTVIFHVTVDRNPSHLGQAIGLVTSAAWSWGGLLLTVACAGAVIAFCTGDRTRFLVVVPSVCGVGRSHLSGTCGYRVFPGQAHVCGRRLGIDRCGIHVFQNARGRPAAGRVHSTCGSPIDLPCNYGPLVRPTTFHYWANVGRLLPALRAVSDYGPQPDLHQ